MTEQEPEQLVDVVVDEPRARLGTDIGARWALDEQLPGTPITPAASQATAGPQDAERP